MIGEWVQDSYTETSPNSEKEVSPRKKLSHRWREASCRVQQPVSWTPNLIACLYTRLQAMSTNPKGKDNRKQYWEQKLIVVAWSKKAVKHTFHSEVQARGEWDGVEAWVWCRNGGGRQLEKGKLCSITNTKGSTNVQVNFSSSLSQSRG